MNDRDHQHHHRGRRSIGVCPMTAAERKRRSRERLDATGSAEITVRLNKPALTFVDQLIPAWGPSRAQVIADLLEVSMWRTKAILEQASAMGRNGETDESVEAFLREHLQFLPGIETMDSHTRQRMADWKEV
jgi:hypothetical protein